MASGKKGFSRSLLFYRRLKIFILAMVFGITPLEAVPTTICINIDNIDSDEKYGECYLGLGDRSIPMLNAEIPHPGGYRFIFKPRANLLSIDRTSLCLRPLKAKFNDSLKLYLDGREIRVPDTLLKRLKVLLNFGWQTVNTKLLPNSSEVITYLALGEALEGGDDYRRFVSKFLDKLDSHRVIYEEPYPAAADTGLRKLLTADISCFSDLVSGDLLQFESQQGDKQNSGLAVALYLGEGLYMTWTAFIEKQFGMLVIQNEQQFFESFGRPATINRMHFREYPMENLWDDSTGMIKYFFPKNLIPDFYRNNRPFFERLEQENELYYLDHILPYLPKKG